ncbi:putative ubiquinol-cytochrome c reductase complex core protein 2 [Phaeomoniella chlamydospora]|uniref:Cytochrome b-c1 complex subunit 2, mitochondrial n=1 Tax=Phaeomoniella chlamydospora TaxID=158046 RepID=A0A0G2FWM2_PHACM|nr:putative ubiquinol-cytochrome c reductase complex core protein 2 [Phaeomoniella chlamydospora]
MLSRSVLAQPSVRALRQAQSASQVSRRGLAAAASGSFGYETGEAQGIKYASRDTPAPTATLAVVAKAGTRYQPLPGLADGLEKFAFKSTSKRSAVRITREAELLGGVLNAYHSRENIVLQAKFLKEDLPYFAELLAEVISKTKYSRFEYAEEVARVVKLAQKETLSNTYELALNSAHGVAFHRGLGAPLHLTSSTPITQYISEETLQDYASKAYATGNIAVAANGATSEELGKWVNEFFKDTFSGSALPSQPSKYYGGEERIAHAGGNTMVIAFNGSSSFTSGSSYKPEIPVLAALLGGESAIKWSPGFSLLSKASAEFPGVKVKTTNAAYSDAGLFYISLSGNAPQIAKASKNVVDTLKKVAAGEISSEEISKAKASAKFTGLELGQTTLAGLEATGNGLISDSKAFQVDEAAKSLDKVTDASVKSAAKSLLESKATVATVGDLFLLPFAEEIGLKV